MWLTRDTLMNGAASGHYFENYVVMELIKNYAYAKFTANLTYYRDANMKEIDVFVEADFQIHPLEIKNRRTRIAVKLVSLKSSTRQIVSGAVAGLSVCAKK